MMTLVAALILSAWLFPSGRAASSVRRLFSAATTKAPAVVADSHTLLSLSFDNTLNGADGETPTTSSGTSYQPGVAGSGVSLPAGNQLFYQSAGNIDAKEGTFECWLKPTWNGNDGQGYAILQYGVSGGMLIVKDGANNLRIILNRFGGAGGSEAGVAYNVSAWTAGQWHHIAFVWSNSSKTLKLYIDGTLKSQAGFSISLPAISSSTFQLGADGTGSYLNAVIDEVRISDIERTADEITADFLKNLTVSSWTFDPATTNIEMYPGWFYWVPLTIRAVTSVGDLTLPPSAATWSSSNSGVAVFDTSGRVKGVSPGTATLTATLGNQSSSISVSILQPARPPVEEVIDPYLATPAAGHLWRMPVVIIRYFPTRDGVNLDAAASGDSSTLADVKARMERLEKQHKFMLEEGSRFRGYKDPGGPPSLGYEVIRIHTVYEDVPPGVTYDPDSGIYAMDYHQILTRFGAERLVNEHGVKEFWIEIYHHGRIAPTESNMSSPLTGDISNSERNNSDMPVYKKTYTAYGINFTRSRNEATHNHGHQLESILSHVNHLSDGTSDLFWKKFVGQNANGEFITGRCGWTHMPPNTTQHYDYDNKTQVLSDIEDWTPAGTGQKKPVNGDYWRNLPYQWPAGLRPEDDGIVESHWYIYWMQNMPGRGNVIPHGTNRMSNWWAFTGDWDASIRAGLGLYEPGACAWAISATSQAVDAVGGSGSVNVTCGSGCKWIASSNAEWITLNGNPFGAGNGSINFTAAPNPGPGTRTGTIAIAGQLFTVAQSAPTPPPAGTITVNTTADTVANDGFCSLREAIIAANTNTASGTLPGECAAGQAGQGTKANDSGTGLLRQAIPDANANSGLDTITFDSSVSSIAPLSALPWITDTVVIDGGANKVELNGSNTSNTHALVLTGAGSAGSTIKNLVINRFLGGIVLQDGSNNNKVQGCYIGTDVAGTTALGNSEGLVISFSLGNQIGGSTAGERNILAGNTRFGIGVFGSAMNRVEGNYIGTDKTGNSALGNSTGILVEDSPDNSFIGNVISGNEDRGLVLNRAATKNNSIVGNKIGTNAAGTAALGNGSYGIHLQICSQNTVGGTSDAARNIVSGNKGHGIVCSGTTATGNLVLGNYFGTDVTGAAALGNQGTGIVIEDAPGNLIGGTTAGARNVVSANFAGITLVGLNAKGNRIEGNFVGTDVTGAVALGNANSGIRVNIAPANVIGGTAAGAGNLISGNSIHGVDIGGAGSTGNRVEGNLIGTDRSGLTALPNGREGIRVEGLANENIIGGTVAGARNVISGNNLSGVIFGSGATRNRVEGNFIGTNINGAAAVPNKGYGVWLGFIGDAPDNIIGGTAAGARNLISGNESFGLVIYGPGADGNRVQGNYIGTNASGTAAIPNQGDGMFCYMSSGNLIGGTVPGARNLIAGNTGSGIVTITGNNNRIEGNYIGTTADGTAGIPNESVGVLVGFNASNNSIGGLAQGAGNLIAFNQFGGVLVYDYGPSSTSISNAILSNVIHSNSGLGIDLAPQAELDSGDFPIMTPNDSGDADTGPNRLQNFPVLSSAIVAGSQLTITGSLNSEAQKTYLIQFFSCAACGAASRAQGQTLIGQVTVTTDGSGNASFAPVFPLVVPSGRIMTATATLMNGNTPTDTSEFAVGIAACVTPTIATQPVSQSVLLGSPVTFSVTAAGTGPFAYQWRRDGTNIPNANGSTYNIPAASYARQGSYDVVVTGACGTATSTAATLTVYNTAAGTNSMVEINAGNANVKLTFGNVSAPGNTTVTPIPASAVPKLPDGYAIFADNLLAFEIQTTATYSGPITVCFSVPSVSDPDLFASLRVLHGENGALVDRTSSHDFENRAVCATVGSLSPFVMARLVEVPVGPGDPPRAADALSDQKAGSVLFFNYYTSSATNPAGENSRINLTNTDPTRMAWVHLFFVDGGSCSVADSFICLTPGQTVSLLASDIDPGVAGYVVAVTVDKNTGCPVRFNRLIGDEYVKTQAGFEANLSAVAVTAVSGTPAICDAGSTLSTLNFDGVSYNRIPRVLAADNVPSAQDGNATMLILNNIGGSLAGSISGLGSVFGLLFDDQENSYSFGFSAGCQFSALLNQTFPRTTPRLNSVIPAGHSGWIKLRAGEEAAMLGVMMVANPGMRTNPNAYGQGHNLHHLTFATRASLTVPVHPPGCN